MIQSPPRSVIAAVAEDRESADIVAVRKGRQFDLQESKVHQAVVPNPFKSPTNSPICQLDEEDETFREGLDALLLSDADFMLQI